MNWIRLRIGLFIYMQGDWFTTLKQTAKNVIANDSNIAPELALVA